MVMNLKNKIESDLNLKKIIKIVQKSKIDTYLVGGYVRDLFLNRKCKDIDFMTIGDPYSLVEIISSKNNFSSIKVFKNFGTASVIDNNYQFEFVGARKESYSKDSRNPYVSLGTFEDDINRRDFTINTLSISLNKDNYGVLVDPFKGIDDINNKIIRTPLDPDITFSDDPLRMMRAIRFATQLGFTIERDCFNALKKNKDRIKIVSQERITDELNKIILSPKPSIGFKLLFDVGILAFIFPQLTKLHGVEEINGLKHKDNFYHTLQVLDNTAQKSNNLWLRWAAILHDIAKPATKRFDKNHGWTFHGHEDKGARMVPGIFRELRLPLDHKMKYVQKLVQLHLRPIALAKKEVSDSGLRRLLFDAGENIEDLMTLCEADITSKNKFKVAKYLNNFKTVRQKLKNVEQRDHIKNWQPPISGEQIMTTFNIPACREVGVIKNAIKEAILEGVIENNPEKAKDFMLEQGKNLGLTPKIT